MSNSRLVYSSDGSNTCTRCGKALHKCKCPSVPNQNSSDGIVRISRETKGRKGAGVTLINGIGGSDSDLKKLAKELKSRCGVGGTIKAGVIEIQGDQRQIAKDLLEAKGLKVKLAGG